MKRKTIQRDSNQYSLLGERKNDHSGILPDNFLPHSIKRKERKEKKKLKNNLRFFFFQSRTSFLHAPLFSLSSNYKYNLYSISLYIVTCYNNSLVLNNTSFLPLRENNKVYSKSHMPKPQFVSFLISMRRWPQAYLDDSNIVHDSESFPQMSKRGSSLNLDCSHPRIQDVRHQRSMYGLSSGIPEIYVCMGSRLEKSCMLAWFKVKIL